MCFALYSIGLMIIILQLKFFLIKFVYLIGEGLGKSSKSNNCSSGIGLILNPIDSFQT